MDEWPIRMFMALYTEACTVGRTDVGLSESFEVKVGTESTTVCCCHGCCLQWSKKWSVFRVSIC